MIYPPPRKFGPEFRHRLPQLLFVAALMLAAFAYGGLGGHYELFPFPVIADGIKTLRTLYEVHTRKDDYSFMRSADMLPERAVANRFEFVAGDTLSGPVLWQGGRYQFLEYCPDWGCLAVEYTATGQVAHAYPFRNDELEQAANAAQSDEFPYELSPAASFAKDVHVAAMSRYANGDLLVVFYQDGAFPYSAGIARIDRDGHPVWFRRDYSHHWPHIEEDGVALVPDLLVGSERIAFEGGPRRGTITLKCRTGRPYLDAIRMIDGNGRILKRIGLIDALRNSPFVHLLQSTLGPDPDGRREAFCDPLHLNFVRRLRDDAGGTWGLAPGDLVASLRNLSAFAIVDGASGRVKRLVRGSFLYQHSVHHLTGSTFLMFDNHGGDGVHGPSRLLKIDLADSRETTVFPNDQTPEPLRNLFSDTRGVIDISPDRRRAMVSFTQEGMAVEVRLADGAVLNAFHSLHDVSNLEQFPEEHWQQRAAVFEMKGLYYIRNIGTPARKPAKHHGITRLDPLEQ